MVAEWPAPSHVSLFSRIELRLRCFEKLSLQFIAEVLLCDLLSNDILGCRFRLNIWPFSVAEALSNLRDRVTPEKVNALIIPHDKYMAVFVEVLRTRVEKRQGKSLMED